MASFVPVFKKKVIFKHNPKLPKIFRMIIVGQSGSGKSVLSSQMFLQEGFFDYNNLDYYAQTMDNQPEMKKIMYAFNKNLTKEMIINLFNEDIDEDNFTEYIDEISYNINEPQQIKAFHTSKINEMKSVDDFDKTKKNLLCIDDFQESKIIGNYASEAYNNLRKYNVNLIYIAQRYKSIPMAVRSNANFVIGFAQRKIDQDQFYNDILARFMDKSDFLRLTQKHWVINPETGHSGYIAVNLETGTVYTELFG